MFSYRYKPWELEPFAWSFASLLSFDACGVVFRRPHCWIGLAPKLTWTICDPDTQTWRLPVILTFIPRTKWKCRNITIKRVIVIEARHAAMFTFHYRLPWPRSPALLRLKYNVRYFMTTYTKYSGTERVCFAVVWVVPLKIVFLTTWRDLFWTFTEILTFMDDFSPKRVSTDWIKVCYTAEIIDTVFPWQRMQALKFLQKVLNFSFVF